MAIDGHFLFAHLLDVAHLAILEQIETAFVLGRPSPCEQMIGIAPDTMRRVPRRINQADVATVAVGREHARRALPSRKTPTVKEFEAGSVRADEQMIDIALRSRQINTWHNERMV